MILSEAVETFVYTMNKIHKDLLFTPGIEVNDVTMPKAGDNVTVILNHNFEHGYVQTVSADADNLLYTVRITAKHKTVTIPYENNIFMEEKPDVLYNFLYGMPDYFGDDWLCNAMNRKMASDLGFRVYLTDYGYYLGISAFGLDFKEAYWKPFYLMLNLGWHKQDNGAKFKEIFERKMDKKQKQLDEMRQEIYWKINECLLSDTITHKRYTALQAEVEDLKKKYHELEAQISMYSTEITPIFQNLFS